MVLLLFDRGHAYRYQCRSERYTEHDSRDTADYYVQCSRFWEKVYSAIQDNLSKMKGIARRLAERAFVIGRRRNVEYLRAGKRVPLWLECQYRFYDKFVFSKIRRAVGVENGNIFPTAGAPLSDTINEFLHICGINTFMVMAFPRRQRR